jgi:hypothetical protein
VERTRRERLHTPQEYRAPDGLLTRETFDAISDLRQRENAKSGSRNGEPVQVGRAWKLRRLAFGCPANPARLERDGNRISATLGNGSGTFDVIFRAFTPVRFTDFRRLSRLPLAARI